MKSAGEKQAVRTSVFSLRTVAAHMLLAKFETILHSLVITQLKRKTTEEFQNTATPKKLANIMMLLLKTEVLIGKTNSYANEDHEQGGDEKSFLFTSCF